MNTPHPSSLLARFSRSLRAMPGRLSFSRLRPRLSNFHQRDNFAPPQDAEERNGQKTSAASLTVTKTDFDNATKTRPQLPDRAKLMQLRHTLSVISDMLDEVDDTVLEILDGSDEGLDKSESSSSSMSSRSPVVVSIDLHLADLQRSSSALRKLVSKYRPEKGRSAEGYSFKRAIITSIIPDVPTPILDDQASGISFPDPVTPDQHACGCLPEPEFSMFSCSPGSPIADKSSSACSQNLSRHLTSSPPPLQVRRQRYPLSPATSPVSVAPLRLPANTFSTRSATSLRLHTERGHRRAFSSPFDYELGYLDGQIGESSDLSRRHPANPDQLSPSSPEGRFSSDSRRGLEPIGEVEAGRLDGGSHSSRLGRFHSRHFSTEEKTRRLRSRRRGSAPSCTAVIDTEPLRMEELMDFLREGNSIREL